MRSDQILRQINEDNQLIQWINIISFATVYIYIYNF